MTFRSRGRLAASAAALVGVALLLTGCRSAVNDGGGGSSGDGKPVSGGTITIASSADALPASLLSGKAGNLPWASNVFQTLTTLDEDREPHALLAKKWELASDSKSIDITLRDDVTFQDGSKLTAQDVKYSFEQAADPAAGSQVGYVARAFSAIDVESDTELHVDFKQPLANIYDFFEYTYIIKNGTFDGLADGSKVIGTGPYTFSDWQPGSKLVLKRNPDYWGKKPYIDEIDIAVITDSTALLNSLRSGTAQMAIGMGAVDAKSFDGNPAWNVVDTSPSDYPLGVDTRRAPFTDQRVRQAVQFAIDRDRINKQVFADTGSTTDLFWTPDSTGYSKQQATRYTYDPEKAKQLIAAAGAQGASFEMTVIDLPATTSAAQIVRNNLEAIGLKPTIKVTDVPTFAERQVSGDLGSMFMPLHGTNGLSPASLVDVLPTLRDGNPSGLDSDEYTELKRAVTSAQPGQEGPAVEKLSDYLLDQASVVVLNQAPGPVPTSTEIHGAVFSPRAYLDLSSAYISK